MPAAAEQGVLLQVLAVLDEDWASAYRPVEGGPDEHDRSACAHCLKQRLLALLGRKGG